MKARSARVYACFSPFFFSCNSRRAERIEEGLIVTIQPEQLLRDQKNKKSWSPPSSFGCKKKRGTKNRGTRRIYKSNTLLERNIARFSREQQDEWRREREDGERKATEQEIEEGDSSSTTLYHSSSLPHPSSYFVRTAKQERCLRSTSLFSSCDSPLVRYTHTHTHFVQREKDGGEGEDPLTTRFVSQCNQASGNLWWMIYQKEFTTFLPPPFPLLFTLFLFFFLNENNNKQTIRTSLLFHSTFLFVSSIPVSHGGSQSSAKCGIIIRWAHPSCFLHGDLTSAGQSREKKSINNDILRINEMPEALLYINALHLRN